jgi:RND superfamily putative drug exporter
MAIRGRVVVVVVAAILLPVCWWLGRDVFSVLKPGGFRDPDAESTRVDAAVRAFGGGADLVVVHRATTGRIDDVENFTSLVAVTSAAAADPGVERVVGFPQVGAPFLLSNDKTASLTLLTLRGTDPEKRGHAERVKRLLSGDDEDRARLQASFGGYIELFAAIPETVESDLRRAEVLAFPITAVLLLLLFRSVVSASLPLVIGGAAIVSTFAILRVLSWFTEVTVFAASLASILGLGLAVDYALFVVARFREERARGRTNERALWIALRTAGRAVVFSGATVAISLLGLFVFPHGVLRSVALGGVAVTAATVLLALTLLPALLSLLGPHLERGRIPFGWPGHGDDGLDDPGIWRSITRVVERAPVVVAVVVGGALLVTAAPFARFEASVADERTLPDDAAPRVVKAVVDRDFFPHQTTPVDVVVTFDGDARSPTHLLTLRALSTSLAAHPAVARVDGPWSLVADKNDDHALRVLTSADAGTSGLVSLFLRGSQARLALTGVARADDARMLALVRELRDLPLPAGVVTVDVGGQSAWVVDVRRDLFSRAPWMVAFIAVVMFVVLFALFSSVALPLKALLMNALSLTASFGVIVFVFQDGRFADVLGFTPSGVSEAVVPVLMLAIVFGLSMDYEVLLLSRMKEEWDRTGDNARAIAHGVWRTGRLITAAALLFLVVVLCFATSRLLLVKTLTVGMAVAVLLDATLVRALLVPATMHLLGRFNWWAPAWWTQRRRR